MAVLDEETQKILVRVVYDGPALAGKTTNVRQLMAGFTDKRRSEMLSPGTEGDRTLFLDWLKVDTGLVAGHHLSCHFITVPGQRVLARRRFFLLGLADVVVFVASAEPDAQAEVKASYTSLVARLKELPYQLPIVFQLNKIDAPSSITPRDLRQNLGLDDDTPVLLAQASGGVGVKETAMAAIRKAADSVQDQIIVGGIESLNSALGEAHELHQWIVEHEAKDGRSPLQVVLDAQPLRKVHSDNDVSKESHRRSLQSIGPLSVPTEPPLPSFDVPSGMIWPANQGRDHLRRARHHETAGAHRYQTENILNVEVGMWSFAARVDQIFESSDEAKTVLLGYARRSIQLGDLCVPRLVWCIARGNEGGGWLWRVAADPASLEDHLSYAVRRGDEPLMQKYLFEYVDVLGRLDKLQGRLEGDVGRGLSDFGMLKDRSYCLQQLKNAAIHDAVSGLCDPLIRFDLPSEIVAGYGHRILDVLGAQVHHQVFDRKAEASERTESGAKFRLEQTPSLLKTGTDQHQ